MTSKSITPFKHQLPAIEFIKKHKRCILADDMGLGKTYSSLFAVLELGLKQILVVSPRSVHPDWRSSAKNLGIKCQTLTYQTRNIPQINPHTTVLILDEAHMLKSGYESQRGEKWLSLLKRPEHEQLRVIMLTGSPMPNGRPVELWALLHAVQHPIAKSRIHYVNYFCNPQKRIITVRKKNGYKFKKEIIDENGIINTEELKCQTRDLIMRRTKDEVLSLPPKSRHIISRMKAAKFKELFNDRILELGGIDKVTGLQKFQIALAIAHFIKIEVTQKLIERILAEGRQCCVFFTRKQGLHLTHEKFHNVGVSVVTGDTKDRGKEIEDFQSGMNRLFLGTVQACGTGVTLTAANYMVMHDIPWSPGELFQTEDRIYRIGQERKVMIYYPTVSQTCEKMYSLVAEKQERINRVVVQKHFQSLY